MEGSVEPLGDCRLGVGGGSGIDREGEERGDGAADLRVGGRVDSGRAGGVVERCGAGGDVESEVGWSRGLPFLVMKG